MAATFAAGALVPFAAWLLLLPVLGALDLYRGATILRPLAVVLLASVAGGLVAGGALGPGLRWRAAFGAAFGATLWIPYLILGSLPALSGVERLADLLVGFTPALATSHALLGALGLVLGGSGWRRACAGSLGFGAAGTRRRRAAGARRPALGRILRGGCVCGRCVGRLYGLSTTVDTRRVVARSLEAVTTVTSWSPAAGPGTIRECGTVIAY